ncbi:MAG: GNAT family N-acetyltransferase [Candidatus Paceibacterota bacterium]
MVEELALFLGLEMNFLATENNLRELLLSENKVGDCLIAELPHQNAKIGYVVYFQTPSTFRGKKGLHIEDLYVTDGFRHKSVGRKLLHAVCKVADQIDCCRIQWEAPISNEKARAFYDSLDVPVVGGWVTYRLNNALSEFARSQTRYQLGEDMLKDR